MANFATLVSAPDNRGERQVHTVNVDRIDHYNSWPAEDGTNRLRLEMSNGSTVEVSGISREDMDGLVKSNISSQGNLLPELKLQGMFLIGERKSGGE